MIAGGNHLVDLTSLAPGGVAGSGLAGVRMFADDLASWVDELSAAELEGALRALPIFIPAVTVVMVLVVLVICWEYELTEPDVVSIRK